MDAVTLCRFSPENVERTFDWVQSKELQRLFTMREEPTWDVHREHFRKVLEDPTQRVYAICASNRHVGNCGLKGIDGNQAELWIYIGGRVDRGHGYGSSACEQLLTAAAGLGISNVCIHVLSSNVRAIHMYERLGFRPTEMEQDDRKQWEARCLNVLKMERRLCDPS